jgi:hypothetical protein
MKQNQSVQEFAKKYKLRPDFVQLIDKNYYTNFTRSDIERFHTNEFIGMEFTLTINALNGSRTRVYKITKILTDTIRCGTIQVNVICEGREIPIFYLRKACITSSGITLNGLLTGFEVVEMKCNVLFN